MDIQDSNGFWSGPARPSPQRTRRESCHSLFTSTLPTIHEVEPLVTPTLVTPSPPPPPYCDGLGRTGAVVVVGRCDSAHGDPSGQLSRILSATTHGGDYIGHSGYPVANAADQHMVTWGFTAFSVEKCGPRSGQPQGNTLTVRCLQDYNRPDKAWSPSGTDMSGSDPTDHHRLNSGNLFRVDSHSTDKTDPSAKLLSDSTADVTRKSCSQKLQLRIMIALGFLFVSGIILWILSPFLPL